MGRAWKIVDCDYRSIWNDHGPQFTYKVGVEIIDTHGAGIHATSRLGWACSWARQVHNDRMRPIRDARVVELQYEDADLRERARGEPKQDWKRFIVLRRCTVIGEVHAEDVIRIGERHPQSWANLPDPTDYRLLRDDSRRPTKSPRCREDFPNRSHKL
jgi:hypothetical protein